MNFSFQKILSVFFLTTFLWLFGTPLFSCGELEHRHTQQSASEYRQQVLRDLIKEKTVASVRIHPDGSKLPIVLLNKETLANPLVRRVLKDTLGFGMDVSHGKRDNVDHGYFRVGDRYLVDIIHQGMGEHRVEGVVQYGSNELNVTGLRFLEVEGYLKQRKENSRVQIELAYVASPKEIKIAETYHKMRRAGLVNVIIESIMRFQAGGDPNNPMLEYFRKQPRMMLDMRYTNNCCTYGMGSRIPEHMNHIQWKVGEMGIQIRELIERGDVQVFLDRAIEKLYKADWKDPEQLHPDMMDIPEFQNILMPIIREFNLKSQQRKDLMAYLVAFRVSEKYMELVREQGSNVYGGWDADPWNHWPNEWSGHRTEFDSQNPRSTALFVYCDWKEAPELFRQGKFQFEGAIWSVLRTENSPNGFKQVPVESVEF